MSASLRIGEVARLVGVTPKTVRHYQKVGLLAPSRRSEAGYRLYTAADLLRLQRIRRLQALGLSLQQIKGLLGDPSDERSWRGALQALLDDVSGQIDHLEERRRRLAALLATDTLDAVDRADNSDGLPPTLRQVQQRLGEHLTGVSADAWEQDTRLYAVLDGFEWPAEQQARMATITDYMAAHPEHYRELVALGERIAALAHLPEDAPEVDQLVEDCLRVTGHPALAALTADATPLTGVYADVLAETARATFSPAQRRFLDEALRRQAEEDKGASRAHD